MEAARDSFPVASTVVAARVAVAARTAVVVRIAAAAHTAVALRIAVAVRIVAAVRTVAAVRIVAAAHTAVAARTAAATRVAVAVRTAVAARTVVAAHYAVAYWAAPLTGVRRTRSAKHHLVPDYHNLSMLPYDDHLFCRTFVKNIRSYISVGMPYFVKTVCVPAPEQTQTPPYVLKCTIYAYYYIISTVMNIPDKD